MLSYGGLIIDLTRFDQYKLLVYAAFTDLTHFRTWIGFVQDNFLHKSQKFNTGGKIVFLLFIVAAFVANVP